MSVIEGMCHVDPLLFVTLEANKLWQAATGLGTLRQDRLLVATENSLKTPEPLLTAATRNFVPPSPPCRVFLEYGRIRHGPLLRHPPQHHRNSCR